MPLGWANGNFEIPKQPIGGTLRMKPARKRQTIKRLSEPIDPAEFNASLSERELQVVRLLAAGLSNKQIGANLEISHKTVKNHVSHILIKSGLNTRTQIAIFALRGGLC
jgi:DNA-binding NarL/FixJ family response regulator